MTTKYHYCVNKNPVLCITYEHKPIWFGYGMRAIALCIAKKTTQYWSNNSQIIPIQIQYSAAFRFEAYVWNGYRSLNNWTIRLLSVSAHMKSTNFCTVKYCVLTDFIDYTQLQTWDCESKNGWKNKAGNKKPVVVAVSA